MGTMTSFAVCMAAVCLSPVRNVTVDRVDLAEINHFYDEQGRLVFDQIIYYDWSAEHSRYNVRDWRLIKSPSQIPKKKWDGDGYVSEWKDFKQRDGLRRVEVKMLRETWTQHDPELIEREFLPQEKRQSLQRIPRPKQQTRRTAQATRPLRPSQARPSRSGY